MRDDVECPYCKKGQEINHDDGYGYEESDIYEQECADCGKVFVYTTSISFYYEAEQAPCKNDGEHDWKEMSGFPREFYSEYKRCTACGEEKRIPIVKKEI